MSRDHCTIGSHPCGNCIFCKHMTKTKSFTNPVDGRVFEIRQFINCKTTKVTYAAQCTCPKLYVGKTIRQLRRRISQHISTINTGADTSLSRHMRVFFTMVRLPIRNFGASANSNTAQEKVTLTRGYYKKPQ